MDKNSFGIELLESGDILKRSYMSLISNLGKTTAIITLIVSALVIFTDIGFYDLGTAALTSTALMLLIASYLMYFSLEDAGERLGEQTEDFKASSERYKQALSKIKPEDMSALRRFCADYSECELDFRRRSRIMALGLSQEDYERYKAGEPMPDEDAAKFKRAERIKPVILTPQTLLERDKTSCASELTNPEHGKLLRLAVKLIPTTACTLFTATVMLSAKDGLNAISVIEGLMKLSALPIIGFKGYAQGYGFARSTRRVWIDTKTRLLEAFTANHALELQLGKSA